MNFLTSSPDTFTELLIGRLAHLCSVLRAQNPLLSNSNNQRTNLTTVVKHISYRTHSALSVKSRIFRTFNYHKVMGKPSKVKPTFKL